MSWLYWIAFLVVYSYLYVDFLYYSYVFVRSVWVTIDGIFGLEIRFIELLCIRDYKQL
jgi:hypothetical protein